MVSAGSRVQFTQTSQQAQNATHLYQSRIAELEEPASRIDMRTWREQILERWRSNGQFPFDRWRLRWLKRSRP